MNSFQGREPGFGAPDRQPEPAADDWYVGDGYDEVRPSFIPKDMFGDQASPDLKEWLIDKPDACDNVVDLVTRATEMGRPLIPLAETTSWIQGNRPRGMQFITSSETNSPIYRGKLVPTGTKIAFLGGVIVILGGGLWLGLNTGSGHENATPQNTTGSPNTSHLYTKKGAIACQPNTGDQEFYCGPWTVDLEGRDGNDETSIHIFPPNEWNWVGTNEGKPTKIKDQIVTFLLEHDGSQESAVLTVK